MRAAVAAKEREVRQALSERQTAMAREASKLQLIQGELQKLQEQERQDIDILRRRLEQCDRELVFLKQDFEAKERAYHDAKEAHEEKCAEKVRIHEHLKIIVMSAEERKEKKLSELLAKMESEEQANGAAPPT